MAFLLALSDPVLEVTSVILLETTLGVVLLVAVVLEASVTIAGVVLTLPTDAVFAGVAFWTLTLDALE